MKEAAEILIEEIRATRDVAFRMYQWGITVMSGATFGSIYTARKTAYDHLVAANVIRVGDALPLSYYLNGTILLMLLAILFSFPIIQILKRSRSYAKQLAALDKTGIEWPKTDRFSRFIPFFYFVFPVVDLTARFYIQFSIAFK